MRLYSYQPCTALHRHGECATYLFASAASAVTKRAERTDHASLTWVLNFKESEGQLARWLEQLQDYSFTIQHQAERLHANADALLWRPELKSIHSQWAQISVVDELLRRRWEWPSEGNALSQLIVPQLLRERVLGLVHGHVGAGHF